MFRTIVFIALSIGLYWLLKWFFGKRNSTFNEYPNKAFLMISVVFALGLLIGIPRYGVKIPGSFIERSDYVGMFYVYILSDSSNVKPLKVTAFINSNVKSEIERDDKWYSWREYQIEYAIMPNGNKIEFVYSDETLKLDKIVYMFDDRERYWGVQLTNEKVKTLDAED